VQEYFYLSFSVTFGTIEVSAVDSCHDDMWGNRVETILCYRQPIYMTITARAPAATTKARHFMFLVHLTASKASAGNLNLLRVSAFLSMIVKFRKATISFVIFVCLSVCLSVCPSVHPPVRPSAWNNSIFNKRILMKFYIWVFFENSNFIKIWQE
jgi:hypothetical protein